MPSEGFRFEQTDKSTPCVLKYRILCKVSFTTWGVFEVALLRSRPVCQLFGCLSIVTTSVLVAKRGDISSVNMC